MSSVQFVSEMNGGKPLDHFWEHTVGSGHARLALRADWQAQLRRCRDELGFRHVRLHGIFDDDMGTVVEEKGKLLYSFFNADQIYDFFVSIGVQPFVELSFMPSAIASGNKTVFHYNANVTPPKDYLLWEELIDRAVSHWVDRYGLPVVSAWMFEVWNEPNLKSFWTGSQKDYFELYNRTSRSIKKIDSGLLVGGPATAKNAWIAEFKRYCETNSAVCDFISTHHYPTDAKGSEGDDTEMQLAKSRRDILLQDAKKVNKQAAGLPVYYTEWSPSSSPRDHLHDESYAAAVIVKTMMDAIGLASGYSYWTFSDIFEENYMPAREFQGGFGLLTLHGVAKPSYRAFQLLHQLGSEALRVDGSHPTVDCWVVDGGRETTVLLTNWALPRHAIRAETVSVELRGLKEHAGASVERIDEAHANPRQAWIAMDSPAQPDFEQVASLNAASELNSEPVEISIGSDCVRFELLMPPQSVAAVKVKRP